MDISINITDDVIENKDDIKTFLASILTDNFNKIIDAVDVTKISAKLGFDSDKKWAEFVNAVKESVSKAVEKNEPLLTKETTVEEENPESPKNESFAAPSLIDRIERKLK